MNKPPRKTIKNDLLNGPLFLLIGSLPAMLLMILNENLQHDVRLFFLFDKKLRKRKKGQYFFGTWICHTGFDTRPIENNSQFHRTTHDMNNATSNTQPVKTLERALARER